MASARPGAEGWRGVRATESESLPDSPHRASARRGKKLFSLRSRSFD